MDEVQHFAGPPDWLWYILFYFFLAGLSGGSYVLATLLRLRNAPGDEPMARIGLYIAFPPMLIAPLLLALDLGQPLRFWHMLINTTPGNPGLNFKYWSPMSIGAWALVVFGAITTVSFAAALVRDGKIRLPLVVRLDNRLFNVAGSLFGLFIAGYTGVLLSVSNQPVWSDTWALGGLFLASGLAGSAALMLLLARYRPDAGPSTPMLSVSERLYSLLELALIVAFALTLLTAGTEDIVFALPWLPLWAVALAGLVPGLYGLATERLSAGGAVALRQPVALSLLVLAGVLALRAAIIFSVQL
ncbi:Formate-dependent nitrite reductase, membrane component NrfD [Nonomuraea solani]|uniref:Formate-dependent nitrite reductase, membrane component NrfD n=1 Tax=Nonomuraea solani TaxID=1144553 RepID=A0A1H5V650_9ACTN|nr:NrfD/PsrC family molybdoenzyme membrane anchor subunit [Nonomuraea solani]SEF82674.1 Formate-dependent nitrite reductase, membrane component NrfD [Nonomuraea solani]